MNEKTTIAKGAKRSELLSRLRDGGNLLRRSGTVTFSIRPYDNYVIHQYAVKNGFDNYSAALRDMVEAHGKGMGLSQEKFEESDEAINFAFESQASKKRKEAG